MTPHLTYERAKRLFDLSVAVPALLMTSLLLVLIAVAIKLDSRGPVIYRGRRIGRYGRPFAINKFRTMSPDAESFGTTTVLHDPRVTRVGQFLRRYKLDELPQLFNVIKGTMSLVGPRPEVEEHTADYDEAERDILTVKPGVTDYASIRFVSLDEVLGSDDPHGVYLTRIRGEKNRLRLKYVSRRSFAEDIRIIGGTVTAIVRKARRRRTE